MPGYEGEIRTDMDAWHRTHLALLFPSLGPALYTIDRDSFRFSQTRDLPVLAIRAIREGFQVLHALDIPIVLGKMKEDCLGEGREDRMRSDLWAAVATEQNHDPCLLA